MWFMPIFFVQESASVSDSDSDVEFHVVARGIPPDVLVDSFLNGLFRYLYSLLASSDPLPCVVGVPDDICVSLTTIWIR